MSVLVVGTGLMGTSVGLALRRAGVEVSLLDRDPANLRTAVSLGAGLPYDETEIETGTETETPAPELVVVGVPPRALAETIVDALRRFPEATVTDLGSVKAFVAESVVRRAGPTDAPRYAGSHPMAGSEQSGPLAARADLFDGRPWAVTPHPASSAEAVDRVEELAARAGAFPVRLTPDEHDEAVALVSHVPQVASSVVAGLLDGAGPDQLMLAGQGLRDVTRIAASDPDLWTQILAANAGKVSRLLRRAARELGEVADRLDARAPIASTLKQGATGVGRLPGKHGARAGASAETFVAVAVQLPDRPGELARLFSDVGAADVNIEDVRIDHSPAASTGLVELFVLPSSERTLLEALEAHGWRVHG